jgi:prevent-host-death family protein
MAQITAFDAKTRFGELLDRVAEGEEIVITRHDKPIARIIPEGRPSREEIRKAIGGLRQLRQQIARRNAGKPKLSLADIKGFIEEGRK